MSYFLFIVVIVIVIGLGVYGNIKQVELTRIHIKAEADKVKAEVKQEIQQVSEEAVVIAKKAKKSSGRKKKN
jgi:predicted Holliday junction resolvase-like endonuclease